MRYRILISCFWAVAMALSTSSCRSPSTDTPQVALSNHPPVPANREDSLLQDILKVHDYGMARMMKLSRYRTRAQQHYDSIRRSGSRGQTAGTWKQLEGALCHAETLMQEWMVQFRVDTLRDDPEKRLSYLEGEKRKVQVMKEAIDASLSLADSLYLKK